MAALFTQVKAADYVPNSTKSENDFIAAKAELRDLDTAGEQQHHLLDGIALRVDDRASREAAFARGRDDGVALGWGKI